MKFYNCISCRNKNDAQSLIITFLLYYVFEIEIGEQAVNFYNDEILKQISIMWVNYMDFIVIHEGFMFSDQTKVKIFKIIKTCSLLSEESSESVSEKTSEKNMTAVTKAFLAFLKNVYDLNARVKNQNKNTSDIINQLHNSYKKFYADIKDSDDKNSSEIDVSRIYKQRYKNKISLIVKYVFSRGFLVELLYFLSYDFFKDAALQKSKNSTGMVLTPDTITSFFSSSLGLKDPSHQYESEEKYFSQFISEHLEITK
jgi:hypothetical protein